MTKKLKSDSIISMPSDAVLPKYIFTKNYTVAFPTTEDWRNGPPLKAAPSWYTDGFKTEVSAGGIYVQHPNVKLQVSLSKAIRVF